MAYALVILALILGIIVGKDFKNAVLFDDIKKKEKVIESKDWEIEEKEREIKRLRNAIDYLQLTYPEIRSNINREITNNTDPLLKNAIEKIKENSSNDENIKTYAQYEREIKELDNKYRDCQTELLYIETSGKYVMAFRNIIIRNAEKLKDEVKVIRAYNYDNSVLHGGGDIEIEFLKEDIPNYQLSYYN